MREVLRVVRDRIVGERPQVNGRAGRRCGASVGCEVARHVPAEVRLVGGRVAEREQRDEETLRRAEGHVRESGRSTGQPTRRELHWRCDGDRRTDCRRVDAGSEQEVQRTGHRADAGEQIGVPQPEGVRAVAAERLTDECACRTTPTDREVRLDVRDQLVQELRLEERRRRRVARVVAALRVARVPVGPVAVEAGSRPVTAGDGPAVGRDQDGVEGGLGDPLRRIGVVPRCVDVVRVARRSGRQRRDVRRRIVGGAEHRGVAATEAVQLVEHRALATQRGCAAGRDEVGERRRPPMAADGISAGRRPADGERGRRGGAVQPGKKASVADCVEPAMAGVTAAPAASRAAARIRRAGRIRNHSRPVRPSPSAGGRRSRPPGGEV